MTGSSMNRRPLDHPAVWYGRELTRRPGWGDSFSDMELAELSQTSAQGILDEHASTAPEFPCPLTRRRLWRAQQELESGCGAVLLKGLQKTGLSDDQFRTLFWNMMWQVGTPVTQSPRGERIFSVRDERLPDGDPRVRGPNTNRALSFHTDRCDVISFLCLSQAETGGENQIVSSMAIYNELQQRRPDLLETLCQPFYYWRHNVDTANERPYCEQPIFGFEQGHFCSNLLRVLIERAYAQPNLPDMTAEQREALDLIESIAQEPHVHFAFRQEPGDLLLLNNFVTYHRRGEFVDAPTATPRHLLRIWLSVPNSRPLPASFAAHYGDTRAGAIRGGMRAQP